jgi:triacylglycerol lipase
MKGRTRMRDVSGSISRATAALALAVALAAALAAASGCAGCPGERTAKASCRTKYPLLFVHGVSWRDDYLISYWGKVPEALEERGAKVFLAKHDAWGTIEGNAEKVAERIDAILAETGAAKVNIIAHSKGGIESRYAITTLGRAGSVATLTTINTPHRGTASARFFLEDAPIVNGATAAAMDFAALFLLGDEAPATARAIAQLMPESMAAFNARVPDDPRVRYQSWTSVLDDTYGAAVYQVFYMILRDLAGPNDGFVPLESAKWGDFRGVLGEKEGLPISHSDAHGLILFPNANRFDAPAFYVSVVEELKERGY